MKTKILKIIQIVYDILSLSFIAVVIIAMAVTPKSEGHHNDNTIDLVETKSRDNLVIQYGWLTISSAELLSRNELYEGFSSSFKNASTVGYVYGMPYMTTDTYYVYYGNYSNSNPEQSVTNNGIALTSAFATLIGSGSQNQCRWQHWVFTLDFSSTHTFEYDVEIVYSDTSTDNSIISVDFYDTRSASASQYYFIVCRSSSYLSGVLNNDEYQSGYDNGYSKGYSIGFDEGYDKGDDDGYNKAVIDITNPDNATYQYIYDLGKQEGIVEGMRGTESNAFIVIGQAFSAVGSIFSIEVLPNLPLWVLVFTPLIIVVVIVVVKLIKG